MCFANQQYLVIGEPLGGLEAGRFELVLKGLEKNVKYMNTEYKKLAQMGSLMRFLVFPSSGREEIPRQGLQYFSASASVIRVPGEYRFSAFSLSPHCQPMEKGTLGAERRRCPGWAGLGYTELGLLGSQLTGLGGFICCIYDSL